MKIWITRYALTSGIEEVEAELSHNDTMATYGKGNGAYTQYDHNNDFHKTKEAAILWAEKMRIDKIASLQKSIEKMQKLRFE